MNLEDQIKKCIWTYPSLYKCEDYRKSRLRVLDHLFNTLGGGYEWAHTKDPKKGGYLLDNYKHYERGPKEGERKFDKPYGSEKFTGGIIDEQYFKDKLFYLCLGGDYRTEIVSVETDMRGKRGRKDVIDDVKIRIRGLKDVDSDLSDDMKKFRGLLDKPQLYECRADKDDWGDGNKDFFSPYPLSDYSKLYQVYYQGVFIQPDWLQGAVDVATESLNYYGDISRYVRHVYYPSEGRIKSDEEQLEKRRQEGEKEYEKLRKLWGYKPGQTVTERKWESWTEFHKKEIEFLTKFLEKYGQTQ